MLTSLLAVLGVCPSETPTDSELLAAVTRRDGERAAAVAASLYGDPGGVVTVYPERVVRMSQVHCDRSQAGRTASVTCGYRVIYPGATILEVATLSCSDRSWAIREAMAVKVARRNR